MLSYCLVFKQLYMRNFYLFVSFVFFINYSVSQVKGDLKTVLNNIKAQELAWNHADLDGYMSFYWNNDSLMFIGKSGITYGWKNTFENYKKGYPTAEAMGKLSFEIVKMEQLNSKKVHVVGKWELKKGDVTNSVTNKTVGGYFTLIWTKINGKWFIVSDHTS